MLIKNNKVYDVLKEVALVVLPALSVLYLALAGIWNLPYAQQISGTIMAIDTFLGALLHVSTKKYNEQQKEEDLK
ncbi:phage holin [Bulleidia sp. zg-1006]|uniref:phage holin n=1 Tax=Bulleidia sp. zg-1006 TaxID=2806552 RepID=UPI0019393EE8|nr:phage holin [Bulleidia sp. zg-1006]QRG86363.1 phage holin [Bulleidia sp. zg-1006]